MDTAHNHITGITEYGNNFVLKISSWLLLQFTECSRDLSQQLSERWYDHNDGHCL